MTVLCLLACGWFDDLEPELSTPSGTWTATPGADTASGTEDTSATETADPEIGGDSGKGETGDSGSDDGCHPDMTGDSPAEGTTRIALIGDYGDAGSSYCSSSDYTYRVARLVTVFDPTLIVTGGDNNYDNGEAETIDQNVGQYYWPFIEPYLGDYPAGPPPEDTADTASDTAPTSSDTSTDTGEAAKKRSALGAKPKLNRFWPSLGNHDWYTNSVEPYTDYFSLPGNERYYVQELSADITLFVVDSDGHEPDGIGADSPQALWLQEELAKSEATWKLVAFHHPSFSSGLHGDTWELQWPFAEWGADLVVAGHDHTFERMVRDGLTYVIDGRGGRSLYYVGTPVAGSRVQYNGSYGASVMDFDGEWMHLRALTVDGALIDEFRMHVDAATLETSLTAGTADWTLSDHDAAEESGWTTAAFDDSAWKQGNPPFGYGLADLVTQVSWGEEAVDDDTGDTAVPEPERAITSWYRRTFVVADASVYATSELQMACDDGCIAYINGSEVARFNMPTGSVDEETAATTTVYSDARTKWSFALDPTVLQDGPNLLAIELHQADTASNDAWLDADLVAYPGTPLLETGAAWTWALSPGAGFEVGTFDDSAWSTGTTPIGAALSDLSTEIELGKKPPISSGYRTTVSVTSEPDAWLVRMRRDDGARLFVDGTEVWRSNLAYAGLVIDQAAPWAISGDAESGYIDTWWPGDALAVGEHVLAVELHQATGGEEDSVMDLQIFAVDLPE